MMDDIMRMEPDELRMVIAKDKGYTLEPHRNCSCGTQTWYLNDVICLAQEVPHWSTDIADAWELVEEMADQGDLFIESWKDGEWFIANHPFSANPRGLASCDGKTTGKRDICLAICRAWLAWNDGKNRYDMGG